MYLLWISDRSSGDTLSQEAVLVDADPTSDTYGWGMTDSLADNAVTVTGDVFIMYSDFGYDFDNNAPGPDMDMMGCDAVLDFPGNQYEYNVACPDAWALSARHSIGFAGCGDWIHPHVCRLYCCWWWKHIFWRHDGTWIDQSGSSSLLIFHLHLRIWKLQAQKRILLNKRSFIRSYGPHESADRDMLHYNIYRDGVVVGDQDPGVQNTWTWVLTGVHIPIM